MLFDFANVLVFTALGLGFVGVNLLIGKLLRPSNPQTRKLSTYECGEPATGSAWVNFNIRFYLVALVFIIFEVEIAFLFPVAVVFRDLVESGEGMLAFLEGARRADHAAAFRGEEAGHVGPDAAAGAGDHHDLPVESAHDHLRAAITP